MNSERVKTRRKRVFPLEYTILVTNPNIMTTLVYTMSVELFYIGGNDLFIGLL